MSIEAEMAVLKRLGFFACVPEKPLRTLLFGAERMHLREGRELYREGDIADSAYIILGGRVDLFRVVAPPETMIGPKPRDYRQIVHAVKAGGTLGALALISDKKRETGAYVAARGDVLRLNRGVFRRLMRENPDMRLSLSRFIFANFQAMIRRMEKRADIGGED